MELKKWYARNNNPEGFKTVHVIIQDAENSRWHLYCSPAANFKPDSLIKVEKFREKERCPECVEKFEKENGVKLQ